EQVLNLLGNALCKHRRIEKEKSQRHDDAEKEKHLVAQRQPHPHARQGKKVCQSRSLLPVSSMNTSSSEGVEISRLTSSLDCASRCFTSETMACGGRWQCNTEVPVTARQSFTPSRVRNVSSDSSRASRTSIRVLSAEACFSSRGVPCAM